MNQATDAVGLLSKRRSLEEQIADNLRLAIQKGTWRDCLPPERTLSRMADVSRKVLHGALNRLQAEGWVRIVRGRPARVLSRRRMKIPSFEGRRVVLLYAECPGEVGEWPLLAIAGMYKELQRHGCHLDVVWDARLSRKQPAWVLRRLLEQHSADCWILTSLSLAVQEWFQSHRLKAVVMGHTYPSIHLPSADYDQFAMARHAAGTLLGLGHRHIACLTREPTKAGDVAAEQGFAQAFRRHADATCSIVRYGGEVKQVQAWLGRFSTASQRPTAMLVAHASDALAVVTLLLSRGIRVPRDLSLILIDRDALLDRMTPPPTCYTTDPIKLCRCVRRLLENPAYGGGCIRLVPSLFTGGTLAPPQVRLTSEHTTPRPAEPEARRQAMGASPVLDRWYPKCTK